MNLSKTELFNKKKPKLIKLFQQFYNRIHIIMGSKICGDHKKVKLNNQSGALQISSNENVRLLYNFEKILGKGSFGLVRVISLKKEPEKKFALKIIEKDKVKEKFYLLQREITILRNMDHPSIINFYECYQDSKYLYIVMEYCCGGDLMDRLLKKNHLDEREVCKIMLKLFSAINYVHKKKIVHRDLKLENVLFFDKTPESNLKIIDFGLSAMVNEKIHSFFKDHNDIANDLNSKVGTPLYVAPEVLRGKYSFECDIWSLGVIMFMLLSGDPPFVGASEDKLFELIEKGNINFTGKIWHNVSAKAKDLISKILKVNPKKRATGNQILKHPWFNMLQQVDENHNSNPNGGTNIKNVSDSLKGSNNLQVFDKTILTTLSSKKHVNKLKKEVLKVLINRLTHKDILNLKEAFNVIDIENTGMITVQELMMVMNQNGYNQSEEDVKKIIKRINGEDISSNNAPIINYSDFLAATLDIKKYFDEQKLWNIFKYFDVSNNDYITVDDLKEIMRRTGRIDDDKEVIQMIKENDLAKDGRISFKEFCIMLDMDIDKLTENQGENNNIILEKKPSKIAKV